MKIYNVKQRSPEWKALRKGKITGTRLKNVLKADNSSVIDELIAEIISDVDGDEPFINAAMQRGIDYEDTARDEYIKRTGHHVEQVGFAVSNELTYLGLSPDGLILLNDQYVRGLEVKCPGTNTHVRYIRQNKIPPEYRPQILNYFLVCQDLQAVDFVTWDDRFSIKPYHCITITRAEIEEELKVTKLKITDFWEHFEKAYNKILFAEQ